MTTTALQVAQMVIKDLERKQDAAQSRGDYAMRDVINQQITGAHLVLCALRETTNETCKTSSS